MQQATEVKPLKRQLQREANIEFVKELYLADKAVKVQHIMDKLHERNGKSVCEASAYTYLNIARQRLETPSEPATHVDRKRHFKKKAVVVNGVRYWPSGKVCAVLGVVAQTLANWRDKGFGLQPTDVEIDGVVYSMWKKDDVLAFKEKHQGHQKNFFNRRREPTADRVETVTVEPRNPVIAKLMDRKHAIAAARAINNEVIRDFSQVDEVGLLHRSAGIARYLRISQAYIGDLQRQHGFIKSFKKDGMRVTYPANVERWVVMHNLQKLGVRSEVARKATLAAWEARRKAGRKVRANQREKALARHVARGNRFELVAAPSVFERILSAAGRFLGLA